MVLSVTVVVGQERDVPAKTNVSATMTNGGNQTRKKAGMEMYVFA
jgi:hypothetical protein